MSYDERKFTNRGHLESELTSIVQGNYCAEGYAAVPVNNATLGLQSVLQALDVRDRLVAVPDFTFPATLHAVIAAGGIPYITDVSAETWQLDPLLVPWHGVSGVNLGAVVVVEALGGRQSLRSLAERCADRNIELVVDAASSFPPMMDDWTMGSEGPMSCIFSFHATKPFAIGEGGICLVPHSLEARVRKATNFGLTETGDFFDGTNAKMDEFAAARALKALESYDTRIQSRRTFVKNVYTNATSISSLKTLPTVHEPTWALFPILFANEAASSYAVALAEANGIQTRRYYNPVLSEGYRGEARFLRSSAPVAKSLSKRMVTFPVYSDSPEGETRELAGRINSILREVSTTLS